MAKAWASSVLGKSLTDELASFQSIYDYPNNGNGTGGQYSGWHIWMDKDLRTILGQHVRGKFNLRYCGDGSLKRCQKLLWSALGAAGKQLSHQQGSNPAHWHSSATDEQISFVPGLLNYKMRYTNRPTGIQQVLSFSGHARGDG
jgi:hypothetical protein